MRVLSAFSAFALTLAVASPLAAATVNRAEIDFEDTALGNYASLQVGDYLFTTSATGRLDVADSDPTGATGNASQTLAVTNGDLRIARADGQAFSLKTLDISSILDPSVVEPALFAIEVPGTSTIYGLPAEPGRLFFSMFGEPGFLTDSVTLGFRDNGSFAPLPGLFAIDNLVATQVASVPLPATLPLLGSAGLILAALRRRERAYAQG